VGIGAVRWVLREVFGWRSHGAQADRADSASQQRADPCDAAAAVHARAGIPGVGPDTLIRRGPEILAAVERALTLPEDQLPRIPRAPRRPADPSYDERLERLKAARNAIAQRLDLAPGVACPNGTLEEIARRAPTTLEELETVRSMQK
jgi:ribonuclease D